MKQLFKTRVNKDLLLYNLKQYRSLLIVYTIMLFAIGPLILLISELTNPSIGNTYLPLSTMAIILVVSVILLFLTPFVIFNYITTKRSVDVYHSLPIRRSDLYLTLSLTSLILVLIPFLFNYALNFGISAIVMSHMPQNFYSDAFSNLIYIIPTLLAISAIPMIVISNTGTLIDGFIHTGILTAFPFALYGTLSFFVNSYGFSLVSIDPRALNFMSPLVALVSIFGQQDVGYYNKYFITSYWLIMFIAATCFSLNIFTKRKSEKSEEPFVNEWYFPTVAGAFTGLVIIFVNLVLKFSEGYTLRSFLDPKSLVFSIVFSYVIYAILNFFRYRSVRTILKTTKQFVVILLVSLALPITLISTSFMGLTWEVPKAKSVKYIEYSGAAFKYQLPIFTDNFEWYYKNFELTEQESIQEFVDFHNLVNRRIRNQKDFLRNGNTDGLTEIKNPFEGYVYYSSSDFTFTYHLKNGDTIKRRLPIPFELLLELGAIIDNTDFIKNAQPIFDSFDLKNVDVITNDFMHNLVIPNLKTFKEDLTKAYFKDIDNLTPNEILYQESSLKYIINYRLHNYSQYNTDFARETSSTFFLTIDSRHPNTLAYLESLEVKDGSNVRALQFDQSDYTSMYAQYGVITKGTYFDSVAEFPPSDLDPTIINRLQGSYFRGSKGKVLLVEIGDDSIAIPIKP